ncbi:CBBY-like protein isoform X1 [Benincasa hispida]|uniref:CBBY-like protein isoform X1 n=1 Tax=Benincasa hispida TaxID=102211 RepID=UPI001901D0A8|nr:CBBY-like protein isoform X1 [Benincasa hispida]XP_038881962.1 CBBY-like protein isoform X1 [Benincasa hispida]
MELTSSSILHTHPIKRTTTCNCSYSNVIPKQPPSRFYPSSSPRLSVFSKNYNFTGKSLRITRLTAFSSSSRSNNDSTQELAVLLEVEGVLVDAYRSTNRQAFNEAFRKLGLDCANWTEPVYSDLVRKNAANEERMLIMYFNRIGWPTSLPTNEKESFIKSVLREKKKASDELMVSQSLPLRPGVEDFIDNAYNEGIPVIILTAYSKSGEEIARSIITKLGPERISKVKIVGNEETRQSLYSEFVRGQAKQSGLEEELAKEAMKAASAEKQRIAKKVASALKLSVEINTTSSESLDKIICALRAGAELADTPVSNCILIAGTQSGIDGAERIGMPRIVLRSSLTSRAEFPSANAIMDGFGVGGLTITRLRQKTWS